MLECKHYTITKSNLAAHELIGLRAEVSRSTDPSREGTKGIVIDESRNTLVLETKKGLRTIPKKEVWMRFLLGKESKELDGKTLVAKPEERTKIFWRKKHGRMQ